MVIKNIDGKLVDIGGTRIYTTRSLLSTSLLSGCPSHPRAVISKEVYESALAQIEEFTFAVKGKKQRAIYYGHVDNSEYLQGCIFFVEVLFGLEIIVIMVVQLLKGLIKNQKEGIMWQENLDYLLLKRG